MTIITTDREAEAYLEAVRGELADLPEEERAELLEDLAQHLSDIAADDSRAQLALTDVLGSPADYAAELRTAAGLPSKESGRRMKLTATDLRGWLNRSSIGRWLNGPAGRRFIGPVLALAHDLRPAWWVARAVILVVGLLVLTSDRGWQHVPVPLLAGSRVLGALTLVGAIALSVWLGRRGYGGRRRLIVAGDIAVALLALSLVMEASMRLGAFRGNHVVYQSGPSITYALASPHGPVTNIYPYDSLGRPLEGVLLYDQDGRPLRVARQEWWADGCERVPAHPLAADGVPVEFSYPIKYTVDLGVFGPEGTPEYQEYRRLLEQRCATQMSRPGVPIPAFPAPTSTSAPADGTSTDAPQEGAPSTTNAP